MCYSIAEFNVALDRDDLLSQSVERCKKRSCQPIIRPVLAKPNITSSSRMRFMSHNWPATKQRLHPQSVAEISRHSVLSWDRIRQCEREVETQLPDYNQVTTQKPKQQLMKTTNICKTKPNETKAWFRSPYAFQPGNGSSLFHSCWSFHRVMGEEIKLFLKIVTYNRDSNAHVTHIECLKNAVHVARVAEIVEPREAGLRPCVDPRDVSRTTKAAFSTTANVTSATRRRPPGVLLQTLIDDVQRRRQVATHLNITRCTIQFDVNGRMCGIDFLISARFQFGFEKNSDSVWNEFGSV